ncbi:MAG: hypothetical protein ACYCW6_09565 [Candidatus Xenobia bacterium]
MSTEHPPLSKRLQQTHAGCAAHFFNTALLFVLINLIVGYGFTFVDRTGSAAKARALVTTSARGRPQATRFRTVWQLENIDMEAFEGVPEPQVEDMLDETTQLGDKGFAYHPWIQCSNPEFHGRYVNVDRFENDPDLLCRRSVLDPNLHPQGRVINVYLFGGSTTFGWDTADAWTVGSYLWKALQDKAPAGTQIRLVNFGRSMWYSSQEVEQLRRLLRKGYRPDIAIFLDGLNDTFQMQGMQDAPFMTERLSNLVNIDQFGRHNDGLRDYAWIPLVRLAYALRGHDNDKTISMPAVNDATKVTDFVRRVFHQNVADAQAMARDNHFKTYFFWQPCPFYKYDVSLHRHPRVLDDAHQQVYQRVYDRMRTDAAAIFLGDLQAQWGHRKVYVDDVHYGPAFSRFLAQQMAPSIDLTPAP